MSKFQFKNVVSFHRVIAGSEGLQLGALCPVCFYSVIKFQTH